MLKNNDVKVLREHLKPLLKHKAYIECIYIYGSAVSNQNANDIDTIIVLNDSMRISDKIQDNIENTCGEIQDKAKKYGLLFHFQPLKMLSRWWHLLLEGEPWIINSLKEISIIYDKKNMLKEISILVKAQNLYKKEERAEKLFERSEIYLQKNRQLLLNSLNLLADAATEAAQILLLFDSKFILNKKKIVEELEKNYENKIGSEIIGNYKEIVDLEEKAEKGSLSEFTAENLDYYLDKVKKFINKVESMLSKK